MAAALERSLIALRPGGTRGEDETKVPRGAGEGIVIRIPSPAPRGSRERRQPRREPVESRPALRGTCSAEDSVRRGRSGLAALPRDPGPGVSWRPRAPGLLKHRPVDGA